jgi:uncharacterized repeat protein (TIGR01451 family)
VTPTATVSSTPIITATPAVTATPEGSLEIVPFEEYFVTIVNTATIGSDQTPTRTATVANPLISRVDPHVTKAVDPTQAHPGDMVTFTLGVRQSQGNSNATNVQIVDPLPIYVDILSVNVTTGITQVAGRVVTWTIPVLAPRQVVTLTIHTLVNDNASPPPVTIRNWATLRFDQGAPNSSNVVTVLVPAPPVPAPPVPAPPGREHHEHGQATPTPAPGLVPTVTATLPVAFLPETGGGPPPAGSGWLGLAVILALLMAAFVFHRRRDFEGQ